MKGALWVVAGLAVIGAVFLALRNGERQASELSDVIVTSVDEERSTQPSTDHRLMRGPADQNGQEAKLVPTQIVQPDPLFVEVDESALSAASRQKMLGDHGYVRYRFVTIDVNFLRARMRAEIDEPLRLELFPGRVITANPRVRREYTEGRRAGLGNWRGDAEIDGRQVGVSIVAAFDDSVMGSIGRFVIMPSPEPPYHLIAEGNPEARIH